jgi:hypothetical protein
MLAWGGGATQSGWANGVLTNDTNKALSGSLAITHTYNGVPCSTTARMSTIACAPSLGTSTTAPATGPNDAIVNNSTVTVAQTAKVVSCGVVQHANSASAGDPMLPHGQVTFAPNGGPSAVSGSGATTLGSGAYATGIVSQTLGGSPGSLLGIGTTEYDYGYGIWFKTTAGSGMLLGLASGPSNTPTSGTVTYDRALTLAGGKVVFTAGGAPLATSAGTYADGNWHFAYASLRSTRTQVTAVLGSTSTSVTLYVDGTSLSPAATGTSLATPSGYWSIGGQSFSGSLSNAVTYNGTAAPTTVPGAPYGAASEHWSLNDNGYTTAAAALPAAYGTPCSQVNLTMAFTGTAPTTISGTLSALAAGAASAAGSLPATTSQELVISTSRAGTYKAEIAGLHLYVPLTFGYGVAGAPNWTQTMTWSNDPTDVFIA